MAAPQESGPNELSHLLASLVAFLDEHRYCGELEEIGVNALAATTSVLPLVLPKDRAFVVQTNRPPIVRADQAHCVSVGDRPPTAVAGLLEAGTALQFNRAAAMREMARLYPLSDELPRTIGIHQHAQVHITGLPME